MRALLAAVFLFATPPAAPFTVYVVDGLTRVKPKDPPGTVAEARIKAARNEYEAFQVVVRSGPGGLKGVGVELSDLKSEAGGRIERRHLSIFREHFLDVKVPSPKSKEPPGLCADPLIPVPAPGATPPSRQTRFAAAPFDLAAEAQQPLWVEIYVPKDTVAGEYTGTVTVTAAGEDPKTVPVRLTVWDFTLPETPSLRTNFGGLGRRLVIGHRMKPEAPEYRHLERRYAEAMAAHRLCPPIPASLRPAVGPDGTIDPKATHAGLKEWIERFHVTSFPIQLQGDDPAGRDRERNVKHLQSTFAYLKQNGWEKYAYVYVFDEPNDAKAYEEVRRRAKMIHEAQPGIKALVTEQPAPTDPAWGTLAGSVDIWVPLWPNFDEKSAEERRKAGEEVWSYTALCQGEKGKDTPFWQLDFPLLNYRIPLWTTRRYGLSGLLYWTMVFWPQTGDPWTNPKSYNEFNGEGLLFYPGSDVGLDGPVASMRLKALRDGLEDYEYFVLAGDDAAAVIAPVAKSWTQWETDPAKLAAARELLAQRILANKR